MTLAQKKKVIEAAIIDLNNALDTEDDTMVHLLLKEARSKLFEAQ